MFTGWRRPIDHGEIHPGEALVNACIADNETEVFATEFGTSAIASFIAGQGHRLTIGDN